MNQADRKAWIDQSKGFAIMLVVLGHVVSNGISSGIVSSEGFWSVFNKEIYSFHMPLFFLISGYLACPKSPLATGEGWRKQLFKILYLSIPYIVFSAIYLFVKVLMRGSGAVVNPVQATDIFLIYKKPIGEYWFLYALILYNTLNLIALWLAEATNKAGLYKGIVLFVLIVAFGITIGLIDIHIFISSHDGLRRPILNAFYFFLGIIISMMSYNTEKVASAFCFIAAVVLSLLYLNILTLQSGAFRILLALAMILMTVLVFKRVDNSFMGDLGKNSLAIYLIHPFIIVLCKMLMSKYLIETVYVTIAAIVSIILPYLAYKFIIQKNRVFNFVIEPKKYINYEHRTEN